MSGRRDRVKRDCTHPIAKHQHGTRAAYESDHCGCFPCRLTHFRRSQAYARGDSWRELTVPMVGSARRLQALHAIGWPFEALAQRLGGATKQSVRELAHGMRPSATVYQRTADRIAALYDELWDVRPEGTIALRARLNAQRKGWLGPLAWDDDTIDDPDAQPYTSEPETGVLDEVLVERYIDGTAPPVPHGRRAPAERREAIRRLAGKGWDDGRIGRRVGMNRDAVGRERQRHGIPAGTPREAA